ncbi:hypothetical protein [Verrucomicrobium sp. BvORR034]|uniref:hypothetical protein n=1 Tax=Verrucomicrobium sp. BvORR034 TaxID=1396418 RepID=UPI0006797DDE|nr:hypothetical protein [Verrucomicrobium sp. BvORR034]
METLFQRGAAILVTVVGTAFCASPAFGQELPQPSNVPDLHSRGGRLDYPRTPGRIPYKNQASSVDWRTVELQTLGNWRPKRKVTEKEVAKIGRKGLVAANGYFQATRYRDRWWLVDPEGKLFLSAGVNTFRPAILAKQEQSYRNHFTDEVDWANKESARLKGWGFNTAGCWSQAEILRTHDTGLAYTLIKWPGWEAQVGPLTAFSIEKGLGKTGTGNRRYKFGIMPVFHPEFAAFVEKHAEGLKRYAGDRRLLGYFLDNELPHPELDGYLSASPDEPGHVGARQAALDWLKARGKSPATANSADRDAWAGYVISVYCEKVVPAMRKHDPHHLILGPRLYARSLRSPESLAAVGRYCDVVSVHPYGWVVPRLDAYDEWSQWSGRPVLVSEWYAKAADTPFRNTGGAGILVPRQEHRGQYYQSFVMQALASRSCVGWHWHRYQDNDPEGGELMASNRGENKGLVDASFNAYGPCVAQMQQLNGQMYRIALSHLAPEPFVFPWRAVFVTLLFAAALVAVVLLLMRGVKGARRYEPQPVG